MLPTLEERVAYLEGRIEVLLRFDKGLDIRLRPDQRDERHQTLEDRITYLEDIVKRYFKD